jgi:PAS domain S-box-containing protein
VRNRGDFRDIFFRPPIGEDPAAELVPFISFIARPRPALVRAVWLAVALATSTLLTYLRFQMDLTSSGVPLVFYLPAIIFVALVTGWEFGLAALLLSVVVIWFAFLPPALAFAPLTRPQTITLTLWSIICVPLVAIAYLLRTSLQHLVRSEGRYRKLVGVLSDIVWVTDADGNIREPRPAWSRVTGTQWPDYAGRGWLKSIHEEDRLLLRPTGADGSHAAEFRLWDAKAGDWRWYRARAVALTDPAGHIREWITTMRDVHESKLARERGEIVIGEARHRLKNLVTIIDALAKSSRRRMEGESPALEAFLKRFLGRLHTLGAAADLVLAGHHLSIEAGAVIRTTLAPFMEESAARIRIAGPPLMLSEATGGSLALAVHELATNAIKYGALSAPDGTVSIAWTVTPAGEGEDVVFEWKEHGGPPPVAPEHEGFGSRVIKSVPAREKAGDVRIEYLADGLYCRIAFNKRRDEPEETDAAA